MPCPHLVPCPVLILSPTLSLAVSPQTRSLVRSLPGSPSLGTVPQHQRSVPTTGLCPVTRRAIGYLLSQNGTGNAVVIVIGGAAESLSCRPGVTTLILKNRKGFVRLALQYGWV